MYFYFVFICCGFIFIFSNFIHKISHKLLRFFMRLMFRESYMNILHIMYKCLQMGLTSFTS